METLFRSTEALGMGLKFVVDEQAEPGKARGTWPWSSQRPRDHANQLASRTSDDPASEPAPRTNPGKQAISIVLKHTRITENVIDVLCSMD